MEWSKTCGSSDSPDNEIISAINPVDMHATDAVAQTLTCNIGMVTQAVTVSWKDTTGGDISDSGDYTITQGTVDSGTNIQKSTLTISSTKLQSLTTTSPLTWKCAAKSAQYPDSEQSAFQNVVVTFVDLREYIILLE